MSTVPAEAADAAYQRQKQLFLELLELPEAQREAELQRLAAAEPELAALLQRRFAAQARELALLDGVDRIGAPPQFPRYRVLRELGRGGMGRVWLAERSDGAYQQQVALKQLDRESWSAAEAERFVRERQILAELDHPHIAALVDGGTDARGAPFLATAYVDGVRIDDWCRGHALPLRQRVALVRDVAGAVAYAHRKLIVHRDLKPANILVGRDGRPKLLDFGIALLLDAQSTFTAEGQTLLTLRYAAPEQVRGQRAGVGADLYALGVLLYELLAEVSPYGAETSAASLTRSILEAEPAPPSALAPPLLARQLDPDLDAICLRALRKRPEDRYRSADQLIDDLDAWLAHQPVLARRGERGYRLRSWLRRRWPWLLGAATAAGFALFHVLRLDRELDAVARERDRARAVAALFVEMFSQVPPAQVRDGTLTARALLEAGLARLRTPAAGAAGQAELQAALARVLLQTGLAAEAAELYGLAVAELRGRGPQWSLDAADAEASWASALYSLTRYDEALAVAEQGRRRLLEQGHGRTYAAADLSNAAGLMLLSLKRIEEARQRYHEALAISASDPAAMAGVRSAILANLGALEAVHGPAELADAHLAEAERLALAEGQRPEQVGKALRIGRLRAIAARDAGQLERARSQLEALLPRATATLGPEHGDVGLLHHTLGVVDLLAARPDDALRRFDTALAVEAAAAKAPGANPARVQVVQGDRLVALAEAQRSGDFHLLWAELHASQPPAAMARLARLRLDCLRRPGGARAATLQALAEEQRTALAGVPWRRVLVTRWVEQCNEEVPAPGAGVWVRQR